MENIIDKHDLQKVLGIDDDKMNDFIQEMIKAGTLTYDENTMELRLTLKGQEGVLESLKNIDIRDNAQRLTNISDEEIIRLTENLKTHVAEFQKLK